MAAEPRGRLSRRVLHRLCEGGVGQLHRSVVAQGIRVVATALCCRNRLQPLPLLIPDRNGQNPVLFSNTNLSKLATWLMTLKSLVSIRNC